MARHVDPAFPAVLNKLMQARGFSQADMARKLDASPTQISRYCRGLEVPSIARIEILASLFGVDRDFLERLAGYRATSLAGAQDTIDPEIAAMLDAERAELHEELSGIEPHFWPIIIEAGHAARQAAAKIARMAAPQSVSGPSSAPNSATPDRRAELGKGDARREGKPKPGGYVWAPA